MTLPEAELLHDLRMPLQLILSSAQMIRLSLDDPTIDAVAAMDGSPPASTSASLAAPCSQTEDAAATNGSALMYAHRAPRTPARRSPIPPSAMQGLPVVFS